MTTLEPSDVELSRIVELTGVTDEPVAVAIESTPSERQALCERLDLVELSLFAASVLIERLGAQRIRADVKFKAVVVQSCVVTLEPIPVTIEESFTQEFIYGATIDHAADGGNEIWVEPEDEPEGLAGDRIDVGELVTQHLALALDPYPRKDDVGFDGYQTETEPGGGAFAALGELKRDAARKRS